MADEGVSAAERLKRAKRALREAQERLRLAAAAHFAATGRANAASREEYLEAARAVLRAEEALRQLRQAGVVEEPPEDA